MAKRKTSPANLPAVIERPEPTAAEISSTLASIDTAMETAAVAGVVDHGSQFGSWNGADSATVFEQAVAGGTFDDVPMNEPVALPEFAAFEFGVERPITIEVDPAIVAALGGDQAPDHLEVAPPGWTQVETSVEPEEPASADDGAPKSLEDVIASLNGHGVLKTAFFIREEIDGREAFEQTKSDEKTGKTNIFRTLKKVRTQMVTKRAAAVLNAVNVDPAFINRELHDGSRYNVYALGKLSDIVYGVSGGAVANEINLAIIRSLFKCRDAGVAFTKETAKACCSKNIRVEGGISKHLVRYTVSPSTAPTQASSTMQALVTLGVVEATGAVRSPVYTLKDAPITRKLEQLLAA